MRIDVVLRYVGIVMLFIAAFMLVSAGNLLRQRHGFGILSPASFRRF